MKDMDLMIIPMPRLMVGVICAKRNAYLLRDVSGVASVDKKSCMPSVQHHLDAPSLNAYLAKRSK
eukprot:490626-Amphidinium_carterae.1